MNNTFSARYRRAAELLPFRADFEERVLERASAGKKPRRLSPSARIPVKIRRAAEIAGLAACLVLAVLCISTLFRGGAVKLPHSTGSVSVRVVGNPDLPVRVPMTWEEAEEQALFDEADAVFSGRVQKLETLELDVGGELTYRSRVTVLVDRTWKGEAAAGETVSLLLPYAVHGESGETEIINRLSEGMKALFLAQTHTEEDVLSNDKGTLALMDTAAYGLKDDRYLILRGAEGEAVLCPGAYPSLPERSSYAEAEALADRLTRQKLTVATISASTSATTTSTAAETTTTMSVSSTAITATSWKPAVITTSPAKTPTTTTVGFASHLTREENELLNDYNDGLAITWNKNGNGGAAGGYYFGVFDETGSYYYYKDFSVTPSAYYLRTHLYGYSSENGENTREHLGEFWDGKQRYLYDMGTKTVTTGIPRKDKSIETLVFPLRSYLNPSEVVHVTLKETCPENEAVEPDDPNFFATYVRAISIELKPSDALLETLSTIVERSVSMDTYELVVMQRKDGSIRRDGINGKIRIDRTQDGLGWVEASFEEESVVSPTDTVSSPSWLKN